MITKREKEIMSIDVYGNLHIIFKKTKQAVYLPKMVQLTKSMLKVKISMKTANVIPLQILTETALKNKNQIALEDFE